MAIDEKISASYNRLNSKAYESRNKVDEKLGETAIAKSSLAQSYKQANDEMVKKVTDPNTAV